MMVPVKPGDMYGYIICKVLKYMVYQQPTIIKNLFDEICFLHNNSIAYHDCILIGRRACKVIYMEHV